MELRHLRYFVAVAEELHFARAAERLHIDQSPLSRAIKDLEDDLGAQLFERTTRGTRMTWAGQVMLQEARRILTSADQARANVRAAARGGRGQLRVGLTDSLCQPRLAKLSAHFFAVEPELELRLFEMSFTQQLKGLRDDLLDVGFSWGAEVGDGIVAEAVWEDPIEIVLPIGHRLASQRVVSLSDAAREPLILANPDIEPGCRAQYETLLSNAAGGRPINVVDQVPSRGMLITLVATGRGIGFIIPSQVEEIVQRANIVIRPLVEAPTLKTYMLRRDETVCQPLTRFLEEARRHADPKPVERNAA